MHATSLTDGPLPAGRQADVDSAEPLRPGALGRWWRQGAHSAFLRRPDWRGLQATPAALAWLIALTLLLGLLVERLYITGPANFFWPALQSAWLTTAVGAWVCWLLVPRTGGDAADGRATSGAALFAMLAAQALVLDAMVALVAVPLVRAGLWPRDGSLWAWLMWLLPLAWVALAQGLLLWRGARRRRLPRALAVCLMTSLMGLNQWLQPARFWYPAEPEVGARPEMFRLTQELFEAQAPVLERRLAALAAPQPGRVDVYALTFAPYAEEDVFLRESRLVAEVMAGRFGAEGRTLQLVNHRATSAELAWATPLNLQRAIERIAARMDRDEDLLFIHLTSHGARSGELAPGFWPLSVDAVTPALLKSWLDAAGIRHRVVSVSACYSGSWIAPLADAHTLVMTAADAEHTSYGCGRESELTYFGRAMFDEELRRDWSFEQAHARAREVIGRREREAGKSDGYSNPQIQVGAALRPLLQRLEHERAAAAAARPGA